MIRHFVTSSLLLFNFELDTELSPWLVAVACNLYAKMENPRQELLITFFLIKYKHKYNLLSAVSLKVKDIILLFQTYED